MPKKSDKYYIPPTTKLTTSECESILNMFVLYDYEAKGKIPRYLAQKLISTVGYASGGVGLPQEVSVRDLILYLDQRTVDRDLLLSFGLNSFKNMASVYSEEQGCYCITPQSLSEFYESIGRPAIGKEAGVSLLVGMLDYDDCSTNPNVKLEYFDRDVSHFAKKNNLTRDFKH